MNATKQFPKSGALYVALPDAAARCGISVAEFIEAVESGEAPKPIASNAPVARRLWRARDLESWIASRNA